MKHVTSGSDLKRPKYIPSIRESEQRAHFIMLLDDHPADSWMHVWIDGELLFMIGIWRYE